MPGLHQRGSQHVGIGAFIGNDADNAVKKQVGPDDAAVPLSAGAGRVNIMTLSETAQLLRRMRGDRHQHVKPLTRQSVRQTSHQ
jgi:hypothetical protein